MRPTTLLAPLVPLAAMAAAETVIDSHDVSSACYVRCGPIMAATALCDEATKGDAAYRTCICQNTPAAKNMITECAKCLKENGKAGTDDNDVATLMGECAWSWADVQANNHNNTNNTNTTNTTTTNTTNTTNTTTNTTNNDPTTTKPPTSTSTTVPSWGSKSQAGLGGVILAVLFSLVLGV